MTAHEVKRHGMRRGLVPGVAVLAVVAICGLLLPVAGELELEYVVSLALFASATNLLLGFGGMVSFGQGVFYTLGAYVVALGYMHHSLTFVEAMLLVPVVGAVTALAIGLLALRTRRLYFALLTLAFSQLVYVIVEGQTGVTGGSNGVFGPMIPSWLTSPRSGFFFVLVVTVSCILLLWKVTSSPYGLVLRAIRDNRERVDALGVDVFAHQLVAFVISGTFCAVAGSLFVVYSQSAYPALAEWTTSGTPVFMAVIGGMFSVGGPIVGAFVYELAHHFLIERTQDWQIMLGMVLLAVVLLRPDGIVGSVSDAGRRSRRLVGAITARLGSEDAACRIDPDRGARLGAAGTQVLVRSEDASAAQHARQGALVAGEGEDAARSGSSAGTDPS